ncbi:hypothetical protein HNR55_001394 [Acetobacter lovaniensis]|uniref:Uncharacterized protein n=1 Tax=Acetobacter lovaniensis TaxID=104100 RepID=A0A841QE51_9PROT|nr:hypothetical protein [Acetobacter lovaniensis]
MPPCVVMDVLPYFMPPSSHRLQPKTLSHAMAPSGFHGTGLRYDVTMKNRPREKILNSCFMLPVTRVVRIEAFTTENRTASSCSLPIQQTCG